MRILKWTPSLRFEKDPSVVPIWVSLFDLPIEYMHPEVIFSTATALGQPLKVDTPTLNMTRPLVARFCVEVDLTKELPKSVKIREKGCKHEQIFTFEHIPYCCQKCCKIGHKEVDCCVGKAPKKREDGKNVEHGRKSDGENDDSRPKKKGIKIPPPKPKWLSRGGEDGAKQQDLEVQILQMNPLVVKAIESVSQPAAKALDPRPSDLMPAETLVQRALESTSGLLTQEKSLIPIDLHEEFDPCVRRKNIDDDDAPLLDDSEEVEVVFSEENVELHQKQADDVEVMLPVMELQRMSLIPQSVIEKSCDDSFTEKTPEEDDEDEAAEEFCWSEGERDVAHVERAHNGDIIIVKRKKGQKSKEERAKLNEGTELRRSASLQE
ncbi:OLC1v1008685C1 [Oldenlandia corymbosa var. corymbosa]|uniref:OLC1v1008685C1 n=1 Tax=Oldenlandia corymbosa var. corymbosa TaxID=529605 RepID=A0AAV1DMQ4_OLDCO|nr:OLC1v1008685C1 [Oldenlandia corymbosa var. corymbosa]